MEIYLDESLKGQSYGAVRKYSDSDGYVSLGASSRWNMEKISIIVVHLYIGRGVSLIGGPAERTEWDDTKEAHKNSLMWEFLLRVITKETLQQMLTTSYNQGVSSGKEVIREAMRELIGVG